MYSHACKVDKGHDNHYDGGQYSNDRGYSNDG